MTIISSCTAVSNQACANNTQQAGDNPLEQQESRTQGGLAGARLAHERGEHSRAERAAHILQGNGSNLHRSLSK